MLGALAKIAKKTADVGKEVVKALLGGQKVPKGHQATEPIDYAAIDSSTKVLGLIYMTMQRAREEELSHRADLEKEHKDNIKGENDRNDELVKALTVRRKPKKKKKPTKEAPKEKLTPPKEVTKQAKPTAEKPAPKEVKPKAEAVKPKEVPPKAEPTAPKAPAGKPPTAAKVTPAIPVAVAGAAGLLASSLAEAGVTEKGQANILAQVKAESNFTPKSENLNYKSAKRIFEVFKPPRIPSEQFAQQFVGNPEALANHVYATTDGNSEPGDGWKYRGRGYLQHTGKNQYKAIAKYTGVDVVSNPDLLNDPKVAAKAVAWFFLNYKKKKPEQLENMVEVNKAVGFAGGQEESAKRAEYAKQFSENLPKAVQSDNISTGNQIDQSSKQNKDMKDAAANAKKQQIVNNVGINQTNTQTSATSNDADYDDRNPQMKKKG